MHLTDTAAIVTGGTSGLGAATAKALAARGARVFVFDLPAAIGNAQGAATQIETTMRQAWPRYVPVDVTVAEQVEHGVAEAAGSGVPLRTVVSCAGIAPSARILGRSGVHDLALNAKVVQVNLFGTFNVLALAAQHIAKTEADRDGQRGIVINTASTAAYDGQIGQAAYSSSKAGVVGLTLPAARDLAQYGIRVTAIAPGTIDTPMLQTVSEEFRAGLAADVAFPRRAGRPEEYAQLVLSIIDNDYINGEVIRLDGALRMAAR